MQKVPEIESAGIAVLRSNFVTKTKREKLHRQRRSWTAARLNMIEEAPGSYVMERT